MSEFKVPALPSSSSAAAAPSASSTPAGAPVLPQDLAMILELMGPPSPSSSGSGLPAPPKETAEEVIRRIEAGQAVGKSAAAADEEEGEVKEPAADDKEASDDDDGSDSDSSDSSDSTSSSVSSASRSVTGAGSSTKPSASIVASHARNALAVSRLTREASADSEPDLDADFFKSANELPAPTAAPALPFVRIPDGQGARELGVVKSVVGKLMVIAHRVGGSGRTNEDVLGEGTVVCWKDGRVLGVVNDTFGPLTAPMYTLILPEPFASPVAPVEDEEPAAPAPAPVAAEEPAKVEKLLEAAPSAEAVVAEAESSAAAAIDGAPTSADAAAAPSPPKDEDLEVEALVQADTSLTSPPETLDSPMATSPVPSTSDLPASPPAPHRHLPPAFPKAELVGLTVFYPVASSNPVPVAQLKRQRWTDASNKFDEECGEEEMDWSDDEAEALAKRRRKMSRGSKAGSTRGGSPTPSINSQWGGSHFDANSDDEGTVLNYSAGPEPAGAASLPKRPEPVSYDDYDAGEFRGEPSSAGAGGGPALRGGKRPERGGGPTRGKGKERASDRPAPSRGGFEARGGGRGGRGGASGGPARGGFDAGRGIGRPRGRGGHMGAGPHNPHGSFDLPPQHQQQPQHQQHQLPPAPPPQQQQQQQQQLPRPMSPTSMAIARATGQLPPAPGGPPSGASSPGLSAHAQPFAPRPYYPQPPYPYPGAAYGPPMGAYGQPGQGPPQHHQPPPPQQQHAFGAPPPGISPLPPFASHPQAFPYPGMYAPPPPQQQQHQQQALQQALQQQQAEHNKQLLEMQRQIALLSRRQAKADGGAGSGAPQ